MAAPLFDWMPAASRNGIVLDTGVLLIHAVWTLSGVRDLERVASGIPASQISKVGDLVDQTVRHFPTVITPQVLAEFQALYKARLRLSDYQLGESLREYSRFPLRETYVEWTDITRVKSEFDAWAFSYTDTSLLIAAKNGSSPVLTTDRALRRLGNRLEVLVIHVYEDYFLHLS